MHFIASSEIAMSINPLSIIWRQEQASEAWPLPM